MVDIAITAANVVPGAGSSVAIGTAAAAITAGQVLYRAANGTYGLADTDNVSAVVRKPAGIAINNAAAGQPVSFVNRGPITIGAAVTPGVAYYLSGNPGAICPVADVAAGDRPAIIGMATSATVLLVDILAPDVTL